MMDTVGGDVGGDMVDKFGHDEAVAVGVLGLDGAGSDARADEGKGDDANLVTTCHSQRSNQRSFKHV